MKVAQKSLPVLNKVNTSMIWYSTYYFKHYTWLSSQYIYLLYFLNKLFVYLDFFFASLLWTRPYNTYLTKRSRARVHIAFKKIRFYKPVTAYLVELKRKAIIFNVYYKTTLEKLRSFSKTNSQLYTYEMEIADADTINKLFS